MKIDTSLLIPMAEANQNFSKVVRSVDENGMAVILKNNKPRYVIIDFDKYEVIESRLGRDGGNASKAKSAEDVDDFYVVEALKLGAELGKISSSYIQRRLCVGFLKAQKIIDRLESLGYISPPDGARPRKVLVNPEDVDEIAEKIKEKE